MNYCIPSSILDELLIRMRTSLLMCYILQTQPGIENPQQNSTCEKNSRKENAAFQTGLFVALQNPGRTRTDAELYRNEIVLSDQAEPLGYDSIWFPEHHFTGYSICANPLLLVAYMPWEDANRSFQSLPRKYSLP